MDIDIKVTTHRKIFCLFSCSGFNLSKISDYIRMSFQKKKAQITKAYSSLLNLGASEREKFNSKRPGHITKYRFGLGE